MRKDGNIRRGTVEIKAKNGRTMDNKIKMNRQTDNIKEIKVNSIRIETWNIKNIFGFIKLTKLAIKYETDLVGLQEAQ